MEQRVDVAAGFDFRKRLGAGHFGEVWRAVDTGLDVECAVKIIPATMIPDKNNFFREAQVLEAAQHQNTVKIREAGWLDATRIYLSMELLEKGSLEDEARGGYVHLTRAKRLMIDVLRGLEHAHLRGILHRDIKPANVLIGANNEGKLSDFGLALPVGVDLRKLGVKQYAYVLHRAPEVEAGHAYTEAADIYACGVTLYRLVNGDAELQATPLLDVPGLAARGEFPDRTGYRAFVPRPLRTVINRAMNPDVAKRYATAEAMRRGLEACVVETNWDEQQLQNGVRWSSGRGRRCYEVVLTKEPDRSWSVTTRQGPSKHNLKRITRLCSSGLTRAKARRNAARVLQDFVLGRE